MLVLSVFVLLVLNVFGEQTNNIIYQFIKVDYEWPSVSNRQSAFANGDFIVENNIISGIKVYKNDVYVTVPRWRPGIPSSLNVLVPQNDGSPLLRPFPSWEMNVKGDCTALQYVQSMEIDPNTGFMWIIDNGRVNIVSPPSSPENLCTPKLVILDIRTSSLIRTYHFPNNVVSPTSNFLNDIVLEYEDGEARYAYITDAFDAKLVVYDFLRNDSYFFQDKSMLAQPLIPGLQDDLLSGPINGIAMSADFSYLYYTVLTAHELYAVSTRVLHNRHSDFAHSFFFVGNKTGGSGGMVCGERSLFYAGFEQRAVLRSDVLKNGSVAIATENILVRDNTSVNWVDTFAFNGTDLWFVANKLQVFAKHQMNFYGNEGNIYIWKVDVGENGYLYRAMERTRNMNIPGVIG